VFAQDGRAEQDIGSTGSTESTFSARKEKARAPAWPGPSRGLYGKNKGGEKTRGSLHVICEKNAFTPHDQPA